MAGYVKDLPQNAATGASETVPWATGGTTLAPSLGEQTTGWQPQAVAGPPDYRIENYARKTQSDLNFRANQAALFLEYALAEVDLTGVNPGVNIRSITIAGNTVTYTDQAGDTEAKVKDAFVALINADLAITGDATASHDNPLSPIQILGVNPGVNIPVSAAVIAGAGTITATGPTDTIMRGADTAWYNADMVLGSPEANGDGDPNHHARIIWDKTNYAFRAGKATGTQWDAGNRGTGSTALGVNCKASGDSSIAAGENSLALADNTIALGYGSTASDVGAVAVSFSTASGQNSLAMMAGLASGDSSIAVGGSSSASQSDTIAIGTGAISSAKSAVALGSADNALQPLQATAKGAVALGYAEDGAVTASGEHSLAIGNGSQATANYTTATGHAAIAANQGEQAHSNVSAVGSFGYHQSGTVQLSARNVAAAGLKMNTNKWDGTGAEWQVEASRSYAIRLECIAHGTAGSASWAVDGLIRVGAGPTFAGTIAGGALTPTANTGGGTNTWTIEFTAVGATTVRVTAKTAGVATANFQMAIHYAKVTS